MSESVPDRSVWERVATILRRAVPRQQFETWFRGMALVTLTPERAELTVPNNFLREWILRKYFGVLRRALREVSGGDPEVEIRIAEESAAPPAEPAAAEAPPARPPSPRPTPPLAYGESDVVLNAQYTFDNFVPGPSNHFAHAAALAVADSPGKAYNPLFLHGSSGSARRTSCRRSATALLERRPDMRILYLSCETFVEPLHDARSRTATSTASAYRYRHVDVLVIDDIHFLANKERTQEEFFHTFNTLYNANKQIVLSSDSPADGDPDARGAARLALQVGPGREDRPARATRRASRSSRRKAASTARRSRTRSCEFLAENIERNIRELEGAVNKVAGIAHSTSRPIDIELAREALRDLLPPTQRPRVGGRHRPHGHRALRRAGCAT